MIRKLSVLLFPLLVLVFAPSVNAQTATAGAGITGDAAPKVKDRIQTKREEFKVKLQVIKDQKKKVLIERIDTKLSNINIKHTSRFAQVLNNLQIILNKMSENLDKTQAQVAINTAKQAVENQAAKTYIITISTEASLKSDVGVVTSQLRLDLTVTHKTVVDAKQAVQALRKNSAAIKKEATKSANL